MHDTNGLLEIILSNIETAIAWAEADKQASLEGGHNLQASDDIARIRCLKDAHNCVNACFK